VDSESYGADKQMAWDMWFRMVEPLAAYKPYMAVPGNHETYRYVHLPTRDSRVRVA
jgi:hypothetical protein